jgi:hypothetical protein
VSNRPILAPQHTQIPAESLSVPEFNIGIVNGIGIEYRNLGDTER